MQSIATALGRLDAPARSRVLVWLRLRFDPDTVPAEPTETPVGAATTAAHLQMVGIAAPVADYDDTLSVEGLGELFEHRGTRPPAESAPPQAVTSLLSGLVAEFQNLARDWDEGCSAPAETHPAAGLLSAAS